MAIEVLRAAERTAVPWLNGGGVTREVAAWPPGAGMTDFDWRVSLADVARGGPFSAFADIDRVITLVDGPGMVLTVAGAEHALTEPLRPFAFPGDVTTDCRLSAGPAVDFNVMTRRGRATARVEIADAPRPVRAAEGDTLLVVCLDGTTALASAGLSLDRLDAVLIRDGGDLLQVDGAAAVVMIRQ